jgi:hypothetical protein
MIVGCICKFYETNKERTMSEIRTVRHTFVATEAESKAIIKAAHANLMCKSKYIRETILNSIVDFKKEGN